MPVVFYHSVDHGLGILFVRYIYIRENIVAYITDSNVSSEGKCHRVLEIGSEF